MDDRAKFYAALRANTAALLNYDIDNLSLQQSLKVDLAASLRLEIDRITAAQLKGESVDLRELVLATESLSRLVAPAGTGTEAQQPDFEGAREKLSQFLDDRAERLEQALRSSNPNVREAALQNLSPAVNEIIAELRAEIERLNEQLLALQPPAPVDQTPPPEQTISPPPPQPSNQPSPTLRAEPPAHYLRRTSGFDVIPGGRYDRWSNRS
jgi:hypothetical protein